ncbi:MAG: amidohydrolase [Candidatus Sumerlaeia bacterium]
MGTGKTLFTNAFVYSPGSAAASPRPGCFAVEDGRFAAFAPDPDALGAVGFDRVEDLGGLAVLPAFTDSHIHLLDLSLTLREVDLEAARSEDEAAALVAHAHPSPRPEQWITGGRWAHNFWSPSQLPSRHSLDCYFPANPVVLTSKCGHVIWCNTAALQAAGIFENQPDVEGGCIEIEERSGRPTGIVKENAIPLVTRHIPPLSRAGQRACLEDGIRHLHAFGILNVHNVEPRQYFEIMLEAEDNGAPPLRIRNYFPDLTPSEVGVFQQELAPTALGRRTCATGKKIFTDGSLGGRTAFMLEPYEGEPDNRGIACMTPEELGALLAEAEAHGIPCAIHAIGDAAVRFTLERIHEVAGPQRLPDAGGGRLPHRIEHLQLLASADIPLLHRVRAVASVQPIHLSADIQPLRRFWGDRSRLAYAFRTVLNCGAPLIFGSDAPVESANPFLGIYAALTRQGLDGEPRGGFYPEEILSLDEAIHAYSAAPPRITGDAGTYGELVPGQAADFMVLDQTCPVQSIEPEEWKDVQVARLYHEGALVFAREA